MSSPIPPRHLIFEPTPEIFATDSGGGFQFLLQVEGDAFLRTDSYDEIRFVFSIWHASVRRAIDLDRGYVELRATFDPQADLDHAQWIRIAEVEPVVAPYSGGDSFDGWIVLPVLGATTAFTLAGSGFESRARLQIRASAYLVP